MTCRQVPPDLAQALSLRTEHLGPLPLINHFLDRLGLQALIERFLPPRDARVRLPHAVGLGVLLRSILVERDPIYRQHETVSAFAPAAFGLTPALLGHLQDDAIGRALDRLFDADRATLLTEVVVAAGERFGVSFDELHNDSTTIRLCGQYSQARGRSIRGKKAPFVTYGHSKEHRPDLKQLLFILTTSRDGGVPVQFRCEAGNRADVRTHEETWDALCRATGRTDFLYVADSKLCSFDPMDHISRGGGRLLCVMPRSRKEDAEFRDWIQTNEPVWHKVWDRPNPRRRGGPRDRWWTFRYHLPSREGWPVVWVRSSLGAVRQEHARRERLGRAEQALAGLARRLAGPRPRLRARKEIEATIAALLRKHRVDRYLKVDLVQGEDHRFRQAGPGRPGPHTHYVRKTRRFWRPTWRLDEDAIAYDRKSDGMYPLLTNDRTLTDAQVLQAHKRQPTIEKRFEQAKTVYEIAPVLLKNEGRVEALFFIYFLALLVQALIERELRAAMGRAGLDDLPIYPEERRSPHPTAEQVFRLFALPQRQTLLCDSDVVRTFEPELTPLQLQVLELMGVPSEVYRSVP
jgi:transposase